MKVAWRTWLRGPEQWLLWLSGLGLLSLIGLISANAVLTYERALEKIEHQLLAETRLMAEQAATSLGGAQLLLGFVRSTVSAKGMEAVLEDPLVLPMLRRALGLMPQIEVISVIDPQGKMRLSTTPHAIELPYTYADRPYFKAHLAGTPLLISPALYSRVGRKYLVPVSLRLADTQGAFAGVALVGLRVDYFVTLFSDFWRGVDVRTLLVNREGTLLFLAPFKEDYAGKSVPHLAGGMGARRSGTFMAVSSFDGTKRIHAYHEVSGWHLYVVTSYNHAQLIEDLLPQWGKSASIALVFIAFTVFSVRLLRQKVREVEQSRCELRAMATTDELSGLPNRRHFKDLAQQELRHAKRTGHGMVVMLVDIDRFKQINDMHGHDVGDEVIRTIGQAMRQTLREGDLLCRWGGEEYAALLLDVDRSLATAVAERVRQAVAACPIPLQEGAELRVTISAGLAEGRIDEPSLEKLMLQADQALYQAKRTGRNRVCLAEPGQSQGGEVAADR